MVVAMMTMMTMPALARAQTPIQPSPELARRHGEISLFEGTLVGAVNKAARNVAKDVQSHTSNANFFSGDARAKGFILDGYGVFVYVEIPALDLTLSLAIDQLERERQSQAAPGQAAPGPVNNAPDSRSEPKFMIPSIARDALQAVSDTGDKYRNEVKLALTDAMLDFSKNLELKPD